MNQRGDRITGPLAVLQEEERVATVFQVLDVKVTRHDTTITYLGPGETSAKSPVEYTVQVNRAHESHGLGVARKMLFDMAREALDNSEVTANAQLDVAPGVTAEPNPINTYFLESLIGDFVRDSVAAAQGHYKPGYATYERMERHLDDQAREIVWCLRRLAGHNPPRDLPVPEALRPGRGSGVHQHYATGDILTDTPTFTGSNDRLAAEIGPLRGDLVALREAIDDLTLTIHADWEHGQVDPATLSARLKAEMRRQGVNLGKARGSTPVDMGTEGKHRDDAE